MNEWLSVGGGGASTTFKEKLKWLKIRVKTGLIETLKKSSIWIKNCPTSSSDRKKFCL